MFQKAMQAVATPYEASEEAHAKLENGARKSRAEKLVTGRKSVLRLYSIKAQFSCGNVNSRVMHTARGCKPESRGTLSPNTRQRRALGDNLDILETSRLKSKKYSAR